jgi:uncharacterized protein YPO0396
MQDRQSTALVMDDEADASETTFRLSQLEIYNWGPFRGLHRIEFDPEGTAIIGPTGSGKTTLVDAVMTLLVDQPRYNLASTGGHDSDRTLFSYVRGVLSGDGSDGREQVARPGKTTTGICATYDNGRETMRLAGLLWTEGPSNAAEDLKRRWLFSQAEGQGLEQWLQLLHDEKARGLMRSGRETAQLRIFEPKKSYLALVRKFFDVGENAFTLLNRAAGLKQLNSIDEIFRDLVLDDRSAFTRALEVAGEFDNLAGIHGELETARRQQESLAPVAEEHEKLLTERTKVERWQTVKRIAPAWFATLSQLKWAEEIARIATEHQQLQSEIECEQEKEKTCRSRVDTLRERYLQLGGNAIEELKKVIDLQEGILAERTKQADRYRRMVAGFQLSDKLSRDALLCNQVLLTEKRSEVLEQQRLWHQKTLDALSKQREQQKSLDEIAAALRKVRERPGSNIPPKYQDFRAELATRLSMPESELPFLAELVEVKSDQSRWRGAIERAIGSERLRILIPETVLDDALRWINHRDNRLHVRLQRAKRDEPPTKFLNDGYTRKLNFKDHPLQGTARRLLAGRDLRCVSSPEALRTTEHGLTIEGMMSGRHGRFEKQDQKRLDEDWMTGFDNKDQLEALAGQLERARQSMRDLSSESDRSSVALKRFDERLQMIDAIIALEFTVIDQPGAELELVRTRGRLTELLDPRTDSSQAQKAYEAENGWLESIGDQIRGLEKKVARLEEKSINAEQQHDKAATRIGEGLTSEEVVLAEKYLVVPPDRTAEEIGDAERDANQRIDKKLQERLDRVANTEKRLIHLMDVAKQVDTGALTDVGADIDDIAHYVERLRVLNEEALPEKRRQFLKYLNSSSDQGVTQLLAGINEEVDAIEQRIRELNQTLLKVDFRSGRYLQLRPQKIEHERLRTLDIAMRKVRNAALKDDDGESHYKSLRELVEILREAGTNQRQLGSRALLDPRYRLQFSVVEVDRQTGNPSPPRTGSQGGSGGEKELMASHVLTASLSYALCPAGANRPLYGTVILDEAFSKSSPSAAGRIVEALRVFCLHPIFVTPNKEIGLLRRHTRKAICVQRPGREASAASISWEQLDELARKP